jgi:hypothetical protein
MKKQLHVIRHYQTELKAKKYAKILSAQRNENFWVCWNNFKYVWTIANHELHKTDFEFWITKYDPNGNVFLRID